MQDSITDLFILLTLKINTMAHTVCTDVGNWVNNNVQQQVERCMEQECNWWCLCCNKWFCFLVWVLVVITTWVITTVCEVVADVIDLVVTVVTGVIDVFVGLFTGDWTRLAAGLGEIVGAGIVFIAEMVPIVTGGTLVGAFTDTSDKWELRNFAKNLLTEKYGNTPEDLMAIGEALGFNAGGFGLRLKATALRSFLRSDFSSRGNDGVPDLITFLRDARPVLDLKMLAGFNPSAWWTRDWPQLTADTGTVSPADLDTYVANNGMGAVKHFTLFSMSTANLMTRTDVATLHAQEIGLFLQWDIIDTQLLAGNEVIIDVNRFGSILQQPPFLRNANNAAATTELCHPLAIAAFGFPPGFNGISAHLADATCLEPDETGDSNFRGEGITGTAFRYRKPDLAFKYVAIHEIGHTFGLCHVDGLLRIMFTAAGRKVSSGSSWWQYWTSGVEAGFTLDEGKKVWKYITDNFDINCLKARPF